MTYQEIDLIFPLVVFGYGAVMTFITHIEPLMKLAEQKFPPELNQQLKGHRVLGLICLVVGSLWSLQNLWVQPF